MSRIKIIDEQNIKLIAKENIDNKNNSFSQKL
jgi:hypothetical protein